MQDRVSTQQVAFLMFLQLLGSALIYVPEAATGRNAWASTLLASLLGLYVLMVIIRLQLLFPGVSIFKLSELSLGPIAGKILNLLYLWVVFFVTILYLYDAVTFLRLIFPLAPYLSLRTLLILAAAYCLYKGVVNVARLAEVVIWFIIFFITVGFLASINLLNLANLLPVLAEWKPALGGVIYGANWPYAEISVFALLLPLVSDLKQKSKVLYAWYGAAVLILFLRTVLVVGVLGPELVGSIRFPLYEVFRLVSVQNFQRIELFFFALWFTTGFIAILVYWQGFLLGVKELLSLHDHRPVILPAGLAVIIMSAYIIPSDVFFFQVESAIVPFHSLPAHLIYPALVGLAAKIGYQRIKTKLNPPSDTAEQSV